MEDRDEEHIAEQRVHAEAVLHSLHQRIVTVYQQYNPDKVGEVGRIVDKYRQQLHKVEDIDAFVEKASDKLTGLHQAICKKYGAEAEAAPTPLSGSIPEKAVGVETAAGPAPTSPGAAAAEGGVAVDEPRSRYRGIIVELYRIHNPEKVDSVDALMEKYKGSEADLYKRICDKYGVAPDPGLLEHEVHQVAEQVPPAATALGAWGNGLWSRGLSTLQTLNTAAEQIREKAEGLQKQMEKSFEDALHSEEEVSMLDVVQSLGAQAQAGLTAMVDAEEPRETAEADAGDEALAADGDGWEARAGDTAQPPAAALAAEVSLERAIIAEVEEPAFSFNPGLAAVEPEAPPEPLEAAPPAAPPDTDFGAGWGDYPLDLDLAASPPTVAVDSSLAAATLPEQPDEPAAAAEEPLEPVELPTTAEKPEIKEPDAATRPELTSSPLGSGEALAPPEAALDDDLWGSPPEAMPELSAAAVGALLASIGEVGGAPLGAEVLVSTADVAAELAGARAQPQVPPDAVPARQSEVANNSMQPSPASLDFDDWGGMDPVSTVTAAAPCDVLPVVVVADEDGEVSSKVEKDEDEKKGEKEGTPKEQKPDGMEDAAEEEEAQDLAESPPKEAAPETPPAGVASAAAGGVVVRGSDDPAPEALPVAAESAIDSPARDARGSLADGVADASEQEARDSYKQRIVLIYQQHNPSKVGEVDKLMEKYRGQESVLYDAICTKYHIQSEAVAAGSPAAEEKPQTASAPVSSWGGGLFTSGLRTLHSLQGAAEGLREHMERTMDEAIRSEEEVSTMQVVQGLRGAMEKSAERHAASATARVEAESSIGFAPAGVGTCRSPAAPSDEGAERSEEEHSSRSPRGHSEATSAPSDVIADCHRGMQTFQLNERLEASEAERDRTARELKTLRSKHAQLIDEGKAMSRRVQAVEERMKVALAEARMSEDKVAGLEQLRDSLQAQILKLTTRAEKAEALTDAQRTELRRVNAEVDKARRQLQGEQQQLAAEQHAQLQRSREQSQREQRLELQLQSCMQARDELAASNAAMNVELQRALIAVDACEGRLQQQAQEADLASELLQRRLEAVELELAGQSLPFQRRVADLEAQLAEVERRRAEAEAEARRQHEADIATVEESRRSQSLAASREEALRAEVQEAARTTSEACAAAEAATRRAAAAEEAFAAERGTRRREADAVPAAWKERAERAERELQEEVVRRRAAEQRLAAVDASCDAQARMGSVRPGEAPWQAGSVADDAGLRAQLDSLSRQRNAQEQENAELRRRADALQRSMEGQAAQWTALEQKFELALQAIGRLQEELEVAQEQRQAYKQQCLQLSQLLGGGSRGEVGPAVRSTSP